ncbi:MAG: hypothetical protein JST87_16550 [Bacteroidetes bacterium]|nr:hypothetical protein [Bacteroidota bacterium]
MKKINFVLVLLLISHLCHSQTIDDYFNDGVTKLKLKNISGAIKDFNIVLRINPKHELALVDRALCWMGQGKWRMAISDSERAIKINSGQAVAYFIRGCAKGNIHENACPDLHKALDLGWVAAESALQQYCK